jgi:hypothetical protein
LIGLAALLLVCSWSLSASAKTDAELSRALLGTWIVPVGSSDATSRNTKTTEVFRADGFYEYNAFSDRPCGHLIRTVKVAWTVKAGVLVQYDEKGGLMNDEIVKLDSTSLTLHSLDDGTTYTRVKVPPCASSGI